jgi:hypothetical protein
MLFTCNKKYTGSIGASLDVLHFSKTFFDSTASFPRMRGTRIYPNWRSKSIILNMGSRIRGKDGCEKRTLF